MAKQNRNKVRKWSSMSNRAKPKAKCNHNSRHNNPNLNRLELSACLAMLAVLLRRAIIRAAPRISMRSSMRPCSRSSSYHPRRTQNCSKFLVKISSSLFYSLPQILWNTKPTNHLKGKILRWNQICNHKHKRLALSAALIRWRRRSSLVRLNRPNLHKAQIAWMGPMSGGQISDGSIRMILYFLAFLGCSLAPRMCWSKYVLFWICGIWKTAFQSNLSK